MWNFGCWKKNERKVPEKKSKCFSGGCLKLMLRLTEKGKIGWASCCETWLKFKVEILRYRERKKNELGKKNVWVVGYPVSWAPCCETWL